MIKGMDFTYFIQVLYSFFLRKLYVPAKELLQHKEEKKAPQYTLQIFSGSVFTRGEVYWNMIKVENIQVLLTHAANKTTEHLPAGFLDSGRWITAQQLAREYFQALQVWGDTAFTGKWTRWARSSWPALQHHLFNYGKTCHQVTYLAPPRKASSTQTT